MTFSRLLRDPLWHGAWPHPCAERALDETFNIQGHPVKVATLDLAMPWRLIEERLLDLVGAGGALTLETA